MKFEKKSSSDDGAMKAAPMRTFGTTLLLALGLATAQALPVVFWSNSPVAPGETLLLGKSGDCAAPCSVTFTPLGSAAGSAWDDQGLAAPVSVQPAQVNNASIMVTLPKTLPLVAYTVSAGGSLPYEINKPDLW